MTAFENSKYAIKRQNEILKQCTNKNLITDSTWWIDDYNRVYEFGKPDDYVKPTSNPGNSAVRPAQYGEAMYGSEMPDKISIWTWNVNGLNTSILSGSLVDFMNDAKPDILMLNETKSSISRLEKYGVYEEIPDGYEQHWNCSTVKKGFAGVCIFTKIKPI